MANFRRNRPKESVTQRNGEWSHPPVEKGRYKFSTAANKRRALAADSTPTKRVSTTVPRGIDYEYIWDWVEVPVGIKIEDGNDGIEERYDPLDTSQFVPQPKKKSKLTRQQRATNRARRLADREQWSKWRLDWISYWRAPKPPAPKEELDLGKQPELIQPRRKRR